MAKILLVEDDQLSREMLTWRLKRKGYEVALAVDGVQALELARRESPDLILLDMSLPALDGWTVAEQLKEADATKAIPIIALTAHAMAGDREKALAAGCDDYDTKPIELARLLEKVETKLGRSSSSG